MRIDPVKSSLDTLHTRILDTVFGIVAYDPRLPAFERVDLKDPKTGRMREKIGVYSGAI